MYIYLTPASVHAMSFSMVGGDSMDNRTMDPDFTVALPFRLAGPPDDSGNQLFHIGHLLPVTYIIGGLRVHHFPRIHRI